MDRSIDFYTRVMGMQVVGRMNVRETGGSIAHLESPRGSQRLELNYYPKGSRFYVPYRRGEELDHLALRVPDVHAFLREHAREFKVLITPFKEGGDWLAYVTDPSGVSLELISSLKRR